MEKTALVPWKDLRVGLAHTNVYGPYVDYIVLQTTELQPAL
jgi:hypothetical protein